MRDQPLVISAPGMILVKNQPDFLHRLRVIADAESRDVVIDFGDTELVDSSGLKMLVAFRQRLVQDMGGRLRLQGLSQDLLALFRAIRLDTVFEIVEPWESTLAGRPCADGRAARVPA